MTLRVLHPLGAFDPSGIECWLMNLLRLRRPGVVFDFVATRRGAFDEEARALGATIHYIPFRRPCYPRNRERLKEIISHGNYDVVHFHLNDYAGSVMRVAAECDVPVRVNHAHRFRFGDPFSPKTWFKKAYWYGIDRPVVRRYATTLLACSRDAGRIVFGRTWNRDHGNDMVYCGIPVEPFESEIPPERREAIRDRYGIPPDALVVGHLGRLAYEKNQGFLLRVFSELAKRDRRYVLFIGGAGERRPMLEKMARKLAIADRVVLPGACDNVPELICGLFDVFCLPSHFEALSVVLMEALAGGLFSVCSDVVPDDLHEHAADRVAVLSLSAPLSAWCDAIEAGIRSKIQPSAAAAAFRRTPFTIERSMESLLRAYKPND